MKKLLSIAALVAISLTGFAQPGNNNGNAYGHHKENNRHYQVKKHPNKQNNHYAFDIRQRDFEISNIMRNYQVRIDQVNSDWRYRRSAKRQIIRDLVNQREREISFVWDKYNHPYNLARR